MQVFCWGRGEDGQLGLGDRVDQWAPMPIKRLSSELEDKVIKNVVCGSGHTGVLTTEGRLYTWGRGDDGRLGMFRLNYILLIVP